MTPNTVGALPVNASELLAQQRAALVATWLQGGRVMTTLQIAAATGTSYRGALHMLDKLTAVLPICNDGEGEGGAWRWAGEE